MKKYLAMAEHPTVFGVFLIGEVQARNEDDAWILAFGLAGDRGFLPETVEVLEE